jgi:hypothetical protein
LILLCQQSALALALTCLVAVVSVNARAEPTQQEALIEAQKLNKAASDTSLQHSTTSAMKALTLLSQSNRPGAISNGYQAYGQYRNSEDLDTLRLKNAISTLKMDSISSGLPSHEGWTPPPLSDFETSYKRVGSKFLHEGEAGKVAEEFEKLSGMKREDFLKHMIRASENKIYPDDPQLVDKVLGRLEGFVKEIPNPEFRGKIQKEIASVPQTVRTGFVSKAVGKFASLFAGAKSGTSDIALLAKENNDSETKSAASPAAASTTSEAAPTPDSASPPSLARNLASDPMGVVDSGFRGVEKEKWDGGDPLGSVLQTAVDEQKEESIFRQISKRYRILLPRLSLNGEKVRAQEAK